MGAHQPPAGEDPLTFDHRALTEQADRLAHDGDYGPAERHYNEAALLDPESPAAYLGLGRVYLQTGRLDQAEWAFRFALRLSPGDCAAYTGLAMICQRRRQYPRAFELYLKCLDADSDNLAALLGLFQTSCQMGTFVMITDYLERYLAMHPDDSSVLFCLATLYARDNKLLLARKALGEVLRLEPGKKEASELAEKIEARLDGQVREISA
jgi:cytochrome c-type biogenesis protein CcmH/NrfG